MYAWSIGYFVGVILSQLPLIVAVVALTCGSSIIYYFFNQTQGRWLVAIFIGISATFLQAHCLNTKALPQDLINKTVIAEGVVAGLPLTGQQTVQFNFIIHDINHHAVSPFKVKLHWYFTDTVIAPGQKWKLSLRLKPPHGFSNPGSSNHEAYYKAEKIVALGNVVHDGNNRVVGNYFSIDQWRYALNQRLNKDFSAIANLRFIKALTLGITSDIRSDDWKILKATGTTHLMAISGLHIGLVAGFVFVVFQWIFHFFPRVLLYCPAQRAASVASIAVATVYSALAGFSLPTQRALIMLSVFMGGVLLKREFAPWSAWSLSLFVVLLINPFNVLLPGFWLSFSAVASIIITCQIYQHKSGLRQKIRVQWIISLLLLPLTIWFFHQFSWTSPLVNMVAIPWVGFLVVPLALFSLSILFVAPACSKILFFYCDNLLEAFWKFLIFFSHLSPGVSINPGPWWVLASLMVGVMLLLMPRGLPCRLLSVVSIIPLFFHTAKPDDGALNLTVLDVGQGLSVVVQTRNHVLVYDAGPKMMGFDAGERLVAPFLDFYQIKTIDMLMISHKDNDHSGGAAALVDRFTVNKMLTSYHAPFCYQGQRWTWDSVEFTVMAPMRYEKYRGNNSSCVLKISVNHTAILLTGDIERDGEEFLLKNNNDLKAAIMVAPHHGSKTSSTALFVKTVCPEIVVFSTGFYNRFHFPHQLVLNRYKNIGATAFDTEALGAIQIKIDQRGKISPVVGYR